MTNQNSMMTTLLFKLVDIEEGDDHIQFPDEPGD